MYAFNDKFNQNDVAETDIMNEFDNNFAPNDVYQVAENVSHEKDQLSGFGDSVLTAFEMKHAFDKNGVDPAVEFSANDQNQLCSFADSSLVTPVGQQFDQIFDQNNVVAFQEYEKNQLLGRMEGFLLTAPLELDGMQTIFLHFSDLIFCFYLGQ